MSLAGVLSSTSSCIFTVLSMIWLYKDYVPSVVVGMLRGLTQIWPSNHGSQNKWDDCIKLSMLRSCLWMSTHIMRGDFMWENILYFIILHLQMFREYCIYLSCIAFNNKWKGEINKTLCKQF